MSTDILNEESVQPTQEFPRGVGPVTSYSVCFQEVSTPNVSIKYVDR